MLDSIRRLMQARQVQGAYDPTSPEQIAPGQGVPASWGKPIEGLDEMVQQGAELSPLAKGLDTAGLLQKTREGLGKLPIVGDIAAGMLEPAPQMAEIPTWQKIQNIRNGVPRNIVKLQEKMPENVIDEVGDLRVERSTREYFGSKALDEASNEYVKWVYNNRGKSALCPNQKTGFSIDFSKSCPMRAGEKGACPYCYVEHPRTMKELGMGQPMSPSGLQENPYRGEVGQMPAKMVTELNRDGGLRMFSFGDFRPGIDDANVSALLKDAEAKGLYIKAITKQPELIEKFGNHPNLRVNISTDMLPRSMSNAPTIEDALMWKGSRENIKVRAVALNRKQAEILQKDPRVDVVTLYHGPTGDKLFEIVKHQNPNLVKRVGEKALRKELATWENMPPKSNFAKDLQKKGKVCCGGGKCSRDATKCGFGLGSLLAGVMIPEWYGHEE